VILVSAKSKANYTTGAVPPDLRIRRILDAIRNFFQFRVALNLIMSASRA
jgi:hypothetical protein